MEQLQKNSAQTTAASKSKKNRKWVKPVIAVVVIVVIVLVLLKGCLGGGSAGMAAGSYLPDTVSYQDMTIYVSGTGTIEPNDAYKVTPLVQGDVLEAPIEEGQQVAKGDVLFCIDSSDLETTLRQAELSLQQAEVSYDQLLKTQADAEKDSTIKATETGVITTLYVEQGDNVSYGTVIADILDRDHMKLTVPFHSADAAGFYEGQAASVTVDGTLETLSGTVDSISATDSVGPGGTLVRNVTILVTNPGALSNTSSGTASVGAATCASGACFTYAAQKQVIAKSSGELESLTVEEGDRVTKDQVMGLIDATDMESQVESARLSVESARLNVEKILDQIEDYTITSTISGTVVEKNYEAGDKIDAASTVAYAAIIYDLSRLTFDMTIDERDISSIQAGQKVEITADALDGRSFTGTVERVSINGTTVSGKTTYPVTVVVDGAPAELYPGMNVSAKIVVEEVGSSLCIPVDYVSRGNVVKVALPGCLDENGNMIDASKIEEREVTLGHSNDEYIVILDGLEEGETVLTENRSSNIMTMMMGG